MTNYYSSRIRRALELLNQSKQEQALVISSNPEQIRSGDSHYPYRANSDLYYFTGITAPDLTLVIRNYRKPHVVLFAPPKDPVKRMWEGPPPAYQSSAVAAGAEIVITKNQLSSTLECLNGARLAYTQSIPETTSCAIRREISGRYSERLGRLPSLLGELERFVAQLRLYKDPSEIAAIKRAAAITDKALLAAKAAAQPGVTEREIGALIEFIYNLEGAVPAFGTIAAGGRSAATLHYRALTRTVRSGELLLIDTGAEFQMYAADITRTFAVGPKVSPQLRDLHSAVLAAHAAALATVKDGVLIKDVYMAAAKELIVGLRSVGALKGSPKSLLTKGAYRPFFPHGIGHSLGLDVHDVGNLRGNQTARLHSGMVFTIEPGLYLPKPIGRAPACGIRIEDDILVTKKGYELLTDGAMSRDLF